MLTNWGVVARLIAVCMTLTNVSTQAGATSYRWLAIDGRQVRWVAERGAPIVLTFAIATSEVQTHNAINCERILPPAGLLHASALSAIDFGRAVAEAFALWQRHIAITFVEISDQDRADIVIGQQAHPSGSAFANVSIGRVSGGSIAQIDKGAICLNPRRAWKIGYDGNLAVYDLVHTLTHEIGHVIGLDHPANRGHVMSFKYHETRGVLTDGDIQGAVSLYGARTHAHSGAGTLMEPAARAIKAPVPHTQFADGVTSQSPAGP